MLPGTPVTVKSQKWNAHAPDHRRARFLGLRGGGQVGWSSHTPPGARGSGSERWPYMQQIGLPQELQGRWSSTPRMKAYRERWCVRTCFAWSGFGGGPEAGSRSPCVQSQGLVSSYRREHHQPKSHSSTVPCLQSGHDSGSRNGCPDESPSSVIG